MCSNRCCWTQLPFPPGGPRKKRPYSFEVGEGELFAFAGLWDGSRDSNGQWVKTCSIPTSTEDLILPRLTPDGTSTPNQPSLARPPNSSRRKRRRYSSPATGDSPWSPRHCEAIRPAGRTFTAPTRCGVKQKLVLRHNRPAFSWKAFTHSSIMVSSRQIRPQAIARWLCH